MELVNVLGVDPSLRKTGLAVLSYNSERDTFSVNHCHVIVNPQKFKGTDAILNMLDMIQEVSERSCYQEVDRVLVESPSIMFNKAWCGGTISAIAHISGGAAALLGLEKTNLFRPNEWNKTRKKEITHNKTIAALGNPNEWNYLKAVKAEKDMEHILDCVSMCLWWITENYIVDKDEI